MVNPNISSITNDYLIKLRNYLNSFVKDLSEFQNCEELETPHLIEMIIKILEFNIKKEPEFTIIRKVIFERL